MIVKVYYMSEDGQTHVIDQAKMIDDERNFRISFTCCPDVIVVSEKEFDDRVRVRYYE